MIKVLFVTHDSSMTGGSSLSLLDMIDALKGRITPFVVLPARGELEGELIRRNITYEVVQYSFQLIDSKAVTTEIEDIQFAGDLYAAYRVYVLINQWQIDIIHSNSSVCDVGALAALISNKPHVWHIREVVVDHFLCDYLNIALKRELLCECDKIVAISKYVGNRIKEIYDVDSRVVYNAISVMDKTCMANRKRSNEFLLVGNVYKAKGQWVVIKAIEKLRREGYSDFVVNMVGDCPNRAKWAIKEYIIDHNLSENIVIYPYMRDFSFIRDRCCYAVNSSRMEALGRTTIEGMKMGMVVIGDRSGATIELIGEDRQRGFLYNSGDYCDLAKCMIDAMNLSDIEFGSISLAAQEYADTEFGFDEYANQMMDIYSDIIDDHCERRNTYDFLNNSCMKRIGRIKDKGAKLELLLFCYHMKGLSLEDHLKGKGFCSVAIYGVGKFGMILYELLESSSIKIIYLIDRNCDDIENIRCVLNNEDELKHVDVVIVSVSKEEESIVRQYKSRGIPSYGMSELLLDLIHDSALKS